MQLISLTVQIYGATEINITRLEKIVDVPTFLPLFLFMMFAQYKPSPSGMS